MFMLKRNIAWSVKYRPYARGGSSCMYATEKTCTQRATRQTMMSIGTETPSISTPISAIDRVRPSMIHGTRDGRGLGAPGEAVDEQHERRPNATRRLPSDGDPRGGRALAGAAGAASLSEDSSAASAGARTRDEGQIRSGSSSLRLAGEIDARVAVRAVEEHHEREPDRDLGDGDGEREEHEDLARRRRRGSARTRRSTRFAAFAMSSTERSIATACCRVSRP